jgi:hypothetical protein
MMSHLLSRLFFLLIVAAQFAPALRAQQADKPPQSTAAVPASIDTKAAATAAPPVAPTPSPLAEAQQLYRTGKYEAAIALYNSIIKTNADAAAASA